MTKKAVLYARVSTTDQKDKRYSLQSQIEAMRKYAAQQGFEIVAEFKDNFGRATPIEFRPEGRKAYAMLKKGIDATSASYSRYGVGIHKGNPRKCIDCGQSIKVGEAWTRDASAADSEYGRIVIIRHSPRCPDEKKHKAFQARLNRAA